MTLSGLHQHYLRYLEVERRMAALTITSYRSDFHQFLHFLTTKGRWGLASQDRLATFAIENVRDYQHHMAAQDFSDATIQRRLVALRCFGTWLVKRRHAPENPLAELEYPRKRRHLPRVVAWVELRDAAQPETRRRERAILALLLYAGLRRGEIVTLNVHHYSRAGRSLHVRGKGSKDRKVSLPREVSEALDEYLAQDRAQCRADEPMFITALGVRITAKVVIRAVNRVAKRFGQPLHPHMFRHSYATELLERGVDLRVLQELLGHESVATTEVYTHVSVARQRRAVTLLEGPGPIRGTSIPPGSITGTRVLEAIEN
jgi:integrase/recombinase XerC